MPGSGMPRPHAIGRSSRCSAIRAASASASEVAYKRSTRPCFGNFAPSGSINWDEQCSDPAACDATSQHAEDPVGDRYIRLGDSCLSVDPLSSQGVHLALQSGLQGAVIVNTMLRKPENTEAAQQFFHRRITERIGRYTGRTKQEYALVSATRPNAFWRERAGDASLIETSVPHPPLEAAPRAPSDQVAVSPHATLDAAPGDRRRLRAGSSGRQSPEHRRWGCICRGRGSGSIAFCAPAPVRVWRHSPAMAGSHPVSYRRAGSPHGCGTGASWCGQAENDGRPAVVLLYAALRFLR